jgi:outer membrane protein assembly factor BamB
VKNSLTSFGALAILAITSVVHADDWPQWRGPSNDGICKETGGLPVSWSPTKNVAWKIKLPGVGSSTPIVWKDRIFLTAADGRDIALLCIKTDGVVKWKKKVTTTSGKLARKDEGNDASATPSTDGKHVWVYTGTGDLACFDFDGNEIWQYNLQKKYGKFSIQHGMHITPLLFEDRLYMALLTNGGHWVIAIDKATGNEVWKASRPTDAVSESREAYTSPVIWKNGADLNLVVLGCDYATGHSLKDGSELWRLGDLNPGGGNKNNHRIICSPVASGDELIVPTCRGLTVVALKQGATGKIKTGSEYEQWRIPKGAPDVPCPLVHDGLVYLQRENGVLICLDVKTGKEVYNERIGDGRYRASPIYADGKIYTVGRDNGIVSVVKAGRQFELLANNRMGDVYTASPSVSQGRIYLRGFETLYAISESGK